MNLQNYPFIKNTKGLSGDLEKMIRNYGTNKFDIPIPTFMELFKEHAVAPFLSSKSFVLLFGVWMNNGIIHCFLCLC